MFGPWANNITEPERLARLRSLRALALVFARGHRNFITALREAEADASWLDDAMVELDRLPALKRRQALATFAVLHWPRQ